MPKTKACSTNVDNKIKLETDFNSISNIISNNEFKSDEKMDNIIEKSEETFNKDKKYLSNNKDNNDLISENNKYKEYLSNFFKNNCSVYPKINGTENGEKRLEDIFNYLVSKNKDP